MNRVENRTDRSMTQSGHEQLQSGRPSWPRAACLLWALIAKMQTLTARSCFGGY